MGRYHYVFPKWSNLLLPTVLVVGGLTPLYAVFIVAFGFSPDTLNVGYAPEQPIPFSHRLHAGDLGIDCRYCHNTVERTPHAAIPPTRTCMNCHSSIQKDSPLLEPLRVSYETGLSVPWLRVHDLPGYAYFDHSAHVNRGVSCVECHGRIDRMEVVTQQEPLSMGWCLECHRAPDVHLRDPSLVTKLGAVLPDTETKLKRQQYGQIWRDLYNLEPSQDCSTCHR
jgi:hypothetical protein